MSNNKENHVILLLLFFHLHFVTNHFYGQLQLMQVRTIKKNSCYSIFTILFICIFIWSLQRPTTTTECKKQLRKIMLFYCYYSFYLYFFGSLQRPTTTTAGKKQLRKIMLFFYYYSFYLYFFGLIQRPTTTTACKKQLRNIMLFYCYYTSICIFIRVTSTAYNNNRR